MVNKIVLVLVALQIGWISCDSFKVDVLMPNVSPKTKDIYLCYRFKLDEEKPIYITEFAPNSTKEIAHHILLYGCEIPGSEDLVWDCGEMHSGGDQPQQYQVGPVCRDPKQSIIYAWAMDAPKLVLPKDVAFKVGGDTSKKYLVMQVHYANVDNFLNGATDNSGISLSVQTEPVPNTAGVYLLETAGYILPHSRDYFEAACEMRENIDIVPFAYRTHAHKLGVVNSGYLVRNDRRTGKQKWTEIGRRSPQLPQMFYPATNSVPVRKGDILAARCTMENNRDEVVSIGPTGKDEMCNFYIMYYTKGDKILNNNICFTPGPPTYYFGSFMSSFREKLDLNRIPPTISKVPEEQIKEMSDMSNNQNMHNMNHDASHEHQHHQSQSAEEDSYERQLEELEERYILNKLLRKFQKFE